MPANVGIDLGAGHAAAGGVGIRLLARQGFGIHRFTVIHGLAEEHGGYLADIPVVHCGRGICAVGPELGEEAIA